MQSDCNIQDHIISIEREGSNPILFSTRGNHVQSTNQNFWVPQISNASSVQQILPFGSNNKSQNDFDEGIVEMQKRSQVKASNNEYTQNQYTSSGYNHIIPQCVKTISQMAYFNQNNAGQSQKTFVEHSHNNIKNVKKSKTMSIFTTIKWKFFANKWLNKTSFMRFKKLNYNHFNLINDKATVINEGTLPNSEQQKNIVKQKRIHEKKQKSPWLFWKRKQRVQRQQLTQNDQFDSDDNIISEYNPESSFWWRLIQFFSENNMQWCDECFKCVPVFSPSGKFKFLWDIIILCVISAFLFMIPLEITFDVSLLSLFNKSFVIFAISILIADFFLAWNFGYYEKGNPITQRSQVILNYIKHGFAIDICASIFLVYDILINPSDDSNPFHLLFVIKIKSIKIIFKKIEERFHLTPKIIQISSLIQLLFLILTVSHIFGCIWVAVAHKEISMNIKSWIQNSNYDAKDWFEQYVTAYYFATVTMITVGYGDYSPVNNTERLVNIAAMLISCGVFAYAINAIGEIFSALNLNKKKRQGDLFIISNFMNRKNIDQELQYEVREFLEYQWQVQSHRNPEKENSLIAQLNPQLRDRLLAESNKIVLQEYKLFHDNFSEEFLVSLIGIMEEQTYRPDELICRELNEQEHDLHFIESGSAIIYLDENAEKIIKHLNRGDSIGEYAFISGQAHSYNIKALEYSTIIRIRRKKFLALIQTFPVDYEIFCCIQDKVLYQQEFSILNLHCHSCKSHHHSFKDCPYIHHITNSVNYFKSIRQEIIFIFSHFYKNLKMAAINKLNKSEFCSRQMANRALIKRPSLILKDFIAKKLDEFNIYNYELIDSYFEQFIEQNDVIEQFSEFSPDVEKIVSKEFADSQNPNPGQGQDDLSLDQDLNFVHANNNQNVNNEIHLHTSNIREPSNSFTSPKHQTDQGNNNYTTQGSFPYNKQHSYSRQDSRNRRVSKDSKNNYSHNIIPSDIDNAVDQNTKFQRPILRPTVLITKQNQPTSPKQVNSPSLKKYKNKEKNPSTLPRNFYGNNTSPKNSHLQKYVNNHTVIPISSNSNINSNIQAVFGDEQSQVNGMRFNPHYLLESKNIHDNNIKMSALINQIVNAYAQRDQEGTINNEEEFEKQKNYDFYLPHNNLSMILEYIKFQKKSMKNMRLTTRQSQHQIKSMRQINNSNVGGQQKESPKNVPSIGNLPLVNASHTSRNQHIFRKFQQQELKMIESKQRRQEMLIKKRKSQKTATTKMQKLIHKFEQISNNTLNLNAESSLAIGGIGAVKTKNSEMSVVENINDTNNRNSRNHSHYQMSHRQSIFSQIINTGQKQINGQDEIKELSDVECAQKANKEIIQDQNLLQPTTYQTYIQNKVRFSTRLSQGQLYNDRKSAVMDSNQMQLKEMIQQHQQNLQQSPHQSYDNEDVSSSSSSSNDTPRNNMKSSKVFKQNFQSSAYHFHDTTIPQNDQSSIFQLRSQKNHESSTFTTQLQHNQSQSLMHQEI